MDWYNDLSALGKSIPLKGISAVAAGDEMQRDNFLLVSDCFTRQSTYIFGNLYKEFCKKKKKICKT